MRLIDADKLKEDIAKGDIVIDEDVLKCETIHDMLLYLLKKVDDLMIANIDAQPTIQPQGIDKDRLIEELEAIKFDDVAFSNMREGWNLGVKKAIRIVKKQPTTDGWIPVSSGELPENGQRVLTTETFSWDSPNDRCVREAYYFKEKFAYYSGWEGEGFYRERNSCHEDYHYSKIGKVHAWRPLPQPYKESE